MRLVFTLSCLLSLTALAQGAAQVCGQILYADQRVACMRTIAGHEVQAEAAAVCGTILYGDQLVQCMAGILDKTYDAGELSACRSILYGDQKGQCMAVAGRKAGRREESFGNDDGRRRRRRVRDEDQAPQRADGSVTFRNDSRRITLDRYYWRTAGQGWVEFGSRQQVRPGMQLNLEAHSGLYDFCAETTDGRSAWWPRIRIEGEEHRLSFPGYPLEDVGCLDR